MQVSQAGGGVFGLGPVSGRLAITGRIYSLHRDAVSDQVGGLRASGEGPLLRPKETGDTRFGDRPKDGIQ